MANQDVEYRALDAKNGVAGQDFDYQLPNHSASGVESAVDELLTAISDEQPRAAPPAPTPAPMVRQQTQAAVPPQPAPAVQPKQPAQSGLARGAHLYAGQGLRLKGEITSCETFTVEGDVEVQLVAQQLLLAGSGTFKGTAAVEEAQIEGTFEGTLQVTGRLLLRSSGRLSGNISYGQIEIERGGQLHGQIAPYVKPVQAEQAPRRADTQPLLLQRALDQQPPRPGPSPAPAYQPEPARAAERNAPRDAAPPAPLPAKPAPDTRKRALFGSFRPNTT